MVMKKWMAAGIVALTVASAAGVTSFAAEKASTSGGYYTPTFTVAVGSPGRTPYVEKKDNYDQAFVGITDGIPTGEAVTLTVMNKDGMVSDSVYYTSYSMQQGGINPVNYGKNFGNNGDSYYLRAVYRRYYTYNPESIDVTAKWKP